MKQGGSLTKESNTVSNSLIIIIQMCVVSLRFFLQMYSFVISEDIQVFFYVDLWVFSPSCYRDIHIKGQIVPQNQDYRFMYNSGYIHFFLKK